MKSIHQDNNHDHDEQQAEIDDERLEEIQDGISDQHAIELGLDNRDDAAIRRDEAEEREDAESLIDAYRDAGFRLVRLKDKVATETAWQDPAQTNFSPARAKMGLRNGWGVGIQCGALSGGLAVLDCDTPAAIEMAPEFLPDTLTVSKGEEAPSHYYYYCPEGIKNEPFTPHNGGEWILDLKGSLGEKGSYIAAPPTIHPTKGAFRFNGGFDTERITRVAATDLRRRAGLLAAATVLSSVWPESHSKGGPGGRHDFLMAAGGYLLRNGETPEDVIHMFKTVWRYRGEE